MKSRKIYDLAKFIYERQEELFKEEEIQTKNIEFDDLPANEKKVMIGLSGSVIGYITNDLEKMRIIL